MSVDLDSAFLSSTPQYFTYRPRGEETIGSSDDYFVLHDSRPQWERLERELERSGVTLRLAYRKVGSGPNCAVLIHGLLDNQLTWYPLMRELLRRGEYTFYTLDLLGHGYSSRPQSEAAYNADFMSALVTRFLEEVVTEEAFHVIGNSLGGLMALAASHKLACRGGGDRVLGLGLLDPAGYRVKRMPLFIVAASLPVGVRRITSVWLSRYLVKMGLRSVLDLRRKSWREYETELEWYVDGSSRVLRQPYAAHALRHITRWLQQANEEVAGRRELRQVLALQSHPVYLVWGRNDPVLPFAHSARFRDDLGRRLDGLLELDCGHTPHLEMPETLAGHLDRFVARTTRFAAARG